MSEAAFRKSALEHCTTSNGDACSYPRDGRDLSTISDDELVWAYAASPKLDSNVSRVAKTAVVKVGFDIAQREAAAMNSSQNTRTGESGCLISIEALSTTAEAIFS